MILIVSLLILLLDQISKLEVTKYLKSGEDIVVIDNFFKITYGENKGAAFGILQDRQILFFIMTILILGIFIYFIYKNYRKINIFTKLSLSFIIGGALGNFIDRIRLGYVVDFISFKLFGFYNFPNFNLADSFIVVGTVMLMIIIIFELEEF